MATSRTASPPNDDPEQDVRNVILRASRVASIRKSDYSRRLLAQHAQRVVKNRPQMCENCGYSKHVEACHLRPVADFPDDALVGEINADNNLALLCPNCHWEWDHEALPAFRLARAMGTKVVVS